MPYTPDNTIIVRGKGTGASASDDNGGGFTSGGAAWDNSQDTNGAVLFNDVNCAAATHDAGAATKITKMGIGTTSVVGVWANVDFDAGIADDRYKVKEIIDADNIALDVAWNGAASQADEIWIGGALAQTKEAATLVTDGDATDVLISQDHTLVGDATFTAGGDRADNTKWLRVRGVDNTGVLLPAGTYRELDGAHVAVNMITFDGIDNAEMRAIHPFDSNSGIGLFINNGANGYNYRALDCKFSGHPNGIRTTEKQFNTLVKDCVFEDNTTQDIYSTATDIRFMNCIFSSDIASQALVWYGATFEGCYFRNGQNAIQCQDDLVTVTNCVFYNQTTACLFGFNATTASFIAYNNIFMPAATADKAISVTGGSVVYADYNCLWSVAGGSCDTDAPGDNDIAVDPQFVNPPTDFTPRNIRVIQGGSGGSAMGAVEVIVTDFLDRCRARYQDGELLAVMGGQ